MPQHRRTQTTCTFLADDVLLCVAAATSETVHSHDASLLRWGPAGAPVSWQKAPRTLGEVSPTFACPNPAMNAGSKSPSAVPPAAALHPADVRQMSAADEHAALTGVVRFSSWWLIDSMCTSATTHSRGDRPAMCMALEHLGGGPLVVARYQAVGVVDGCAVHREPRHCAQAPTSTNANAQSHSSCNFYAGLCDFRAATVAVSAPASLITNACMLFTAMHLPVSAASSRKSVISLSVSCLNRARSSAGFAC
jgi:hypothetical protein